MSTRLIRAMAGFLAWDLTPHDRSQVASFDSSGRFQRMIARRGQGPGELQEVFGIAVGPGDTVHIVESYGRSLFTSRGSYVRREAFPPGYEEMLLLPGGKAVLSARLPAPERSGLPLHMLSGGGATTKSFGVDNPAVAMGRLAASNDDAASFQRRRLLAAEPGTFWTYNPTRFLLQLFDTAGNRHVDVVHEEDGWYADASRRNPGKGSSRGLNLAYAIAGSEPGLMWLVYHDRRSNFERDMSAATDAAGMMAVLDVVVEAFDTHALTVLAVARFPNNRAMPVLNAPDHLALMLAGADGEHTYRIVRLKLGRQ